MRFLVVDPERGYAFALGRALRRQGHDAFLASTVADALEIVDGDVDAAIVHATMPAGEHGVGSLAGLLGRRCPDLVIVHWLPYGVEVAEIAGDCVLARLWTIDNVLALVERVRRRRFAGAVARREARHA